MKKILLSILFISSVCSLFAQTTYDVVVGPGLTYSPAILTITQGDAVTFTLAGGYHDVNFETSSITGVSFDNPSQVESIPMQSLEGLMGSITFDVPGVYNYDCSGYGHAASGMVGSITVMASVSVSNTVVDVIINSDDHTTLEAAVIAANLAETLSGDGPFTVFAPTDAAFELLPADVLSSLLADPSGALTQILLSHVASGNVLSSDLTDGMMVTTLADSVFVSVSIDNGVVMINNATVTMADIQTDNGVVHVVDAVITTDEEEVTNTIVDIVVASENHTTLETAVIAAGLAETLSSEGPFTVFAPTDAAFELIPADVMSSLLMDPMGSLTYVLTHHVHSGNVLSTDLTDGMMVPTVAGTDLTVSITDQGVFIDGAAVSQADIVADNGVIHVIDAVMVPSDLDIEESPFSINESKYLYSVDVLGKRVAEDTRGIVIFDKYSSGNVIKRFKF